MRISRFCILVFIVLLQDFRTSYGEALLTAHYSILASADGRELGLTPLGGITNIAIGGVKDESSNTPLPEPIFFEGSASAGHGGSSATIHATAKAAVGDIGIGIVSGAISSHFSGQFPLPPQAFGGGEARAEILALEAGWAEISKVIAPRRSPGELLRFKSTLLLDGAFVSSSNLGDMDFPGGQAQATLQVFERSDNYQLPPSPYPSDIWAQISDAPHNNVKTVDDVPGAVKVEYFMRVGQNFAFDVNFRLLGSARAANGGTSILTADFTGSLKWGGIDEVTDLDGNVIPRDEWTIESESGFDYSRSFDEQVPEPSSFLLVGIALFARLASVRKQR